MLCTWLHTYPASSPSTPPQPPRCSLDPPTSWWSSRSPGAGSGPFCLHCLSPHHPALSRLFTEHTEEGGWVGSGVSRTLCSGAHILSHPHLLGRNACVCTQPCVLCERFKEGENPSSPPQIILTHSFTCLARELHQPVSRGETDIHPHLAKGPESNSC